MILEDLFLFRSFHAGKQKLGSLTERTRKDLQGHVYYTVQSAAMPFSPKSEVEGNIPLTEILVYFVGANIPLKSSLTAELQPSQLNDFATLLCAVPSSSQYSRRTKPEQEFCLVLSSPVLRTKPGLPEYLRVSPG